MGIYLNEHEIGFDTYEVGFPNLGGCMGVVLLTEHGLFGYHLPPMTLDSGRAGEFAGFCQSHRHFGKLLHLFGSCKRETRYGTGRFMKWAEEMKSLATALGYRGQVSGYDMPVTERSGSGTDVGTGYIEYTRDRLSGAVTVSHSQMASVVPQKLKDSATEIRTIAKRDGKLQLSPPYNYNVIQSVTKTANAMTPVGDDGFYTFVL
jgi:hypothetical protein